MEEEDTVQYWLYPGPDTADADGLATLTHVFGTVDTWTRDYVWTRDKFNLRVERLPGTGGWCLAGRTYYGENVLDEWFIVSLLVEVTRTTELVARVTDTDGEILLIQAADQLPAWAGEPELAAGRVFLRRGSVHLIPVCRDPGSVSPLPGVTPPPWVAAAVVARYPHLTLASDRVQAAIRAKVAAMPRDTRNNHHVTNVTLPAAVARLLARDPAYLSLLVAAVAERDPVDMRRGRAMARVRPVAMSRRSVRFSRCLYAMVAGTKVTPHRSSGWSLEQGDNTGFKLSLGLEILLARRRGGGGGGVGDNEGEHNAVIQNKQWLQFKEQLKKNGYFRNEMEGSQLFKVLELNALNFFSDSSDETRRDHNIDEDFKKIVDSGDDYSLEGAIVGPPVDKEDSEDWMEMTPEMLDAMLEAQFGVSKGEPSQNIPDEVNKFLNKVSDMAGVEHEQDEIKFDPENLVSSMQKLLSSMEKENNEKLFESDDSDSDDSDDGVEDPIMMDYLSKLDSEVPKEEDDINRPLDIDQNVLSNLLQSYSEELGHGPVSSLFQSMRVNPGRKDTINTS